MTANHAHTPIGVHQEVLQAYIAQGGTIQRFYEWFDATQARAERRGLNEKREEIEAAAEQRGAIKALRDAADDLFYDGDTDRPLPGYTELLDRADQIEQEGDDGQS